MENTQAKKEVFTSETSIFSANNKRPSNDQSRMPTWALLAILIVAFFLLKTFIYITDEKRKGK